MEFLDFCKLHMNPNHFGQVNRIVIDRGICFNSLLTKGHSDLGSIRGIGPALQLSLQNMQVAYRLEIEVMKDQANSEQIMRDALKADAHHDAVLNGEYTDKPVEIPSCDVEEQLDRDAEVYDQEIDRLLSEPDENIVEEERSYYICLFQEGVCKYYVGLTSTSIRTTRTLANATIGSDLDAIKARAVFLRDKLSSRGISVHVRECK